MAKLVPFTTPLSGNDQNWPLGSQPPGTGLRSVNVWPEDRDGRLRGATRPGTEKLLTSAVASAPVMQMAQCTYLADGSSATGVTAIGAKITIKLLLKGTKGYIHVDGTELWTSHHEGYRPTHRISISGLSRSGGTATATSAGHGLQAGWRITIAGAAQSEYNGYKTILTATTDTFTYTVSGSPATPATGTIVGHIGSSAGTVWITPETHTLATGKLTSTATTATVEHAGHGLATGNTVTVSGATQTEYNGLYTVTVSDSSHFTYTFAGSATSPATGTIRFRATAESWVPTWTAEDDPSGSYERTEHHTLPYGIDLGTETQVRVAGSTGPVIATITQQPSSANGYQAHIYYEHDTPTDGSGGYVTLSITWGATETPDISPSRTTRLAVVCNGTLYVVSERTATAASFGSGVTIDSTVKPQLVFMFGVLYIVDGGQYVKYCKLANGAPYTVYHLAAASGEGTVPTYCTLACGWRGRLLLAGDSTGATPHQYYASQCGPTISSGLLDNWDYGDDDSAVDAWAGQSSLYGRLGEPITAMIPWKDDYLLLSGANSLWLIAGDPAAGGAVGQLSASIGILGPDAWTWSDDGLLYFIGTGGFYRMSPGGAPENMSRGRLHQWFTTLNWSSTIIEVEWDRDRQGCWIFAAATPADSATEATTACWYDRRADGMFPMEFPAAHGPVSAIVWDGDGPDDRVLYLGGRDGYVRRSSAGTLSDDGESITAEMVFGPVAPMSPGTRSKLLRLEAILGNIPPTIGEANWSVNWRVTVADDPYAAVLSPTQYAEGTWTGGNRRESVSVRLSGTYFYLVLDSVGSAWSVERIDGLFAEAGKIR